MMRIPRLLRFAVVLAGCCGHVARSPVVADDHPPTFTAVSAIFERHCLSCHRDDQPQGELSLQSADFLQRTDLVDRDEPQRSGLLEMVAPAEGKVRMPKGGPPLPDGDVSALRQWLDEGAPWPAGVVLTAPELAGTDWWSLQRLDRPPVPAIPTMVRSDGPNPIDAFILAAQQPHGLRPAPIADRPTLIRRLYFDLLGLPPAPSDIERFVQNRNPAAYEQLVDELLASPQYGERWARHWLDVVHFGESHGYDKDKPRANAWPYRDYVIRQLNRDLRYDRFVMEQLAGDVLWPDDPRALEATGFLSAGPWDFIGHAEVPESKIDGQIARNLDRDDMVSNTMNTFVSTTVQCARCHDHKFDPVRQEHYYSLQSVFAAVDRADRSYDVDPQLRKQRAELAARVAVLRAELTTMQQQRLAATTPTGWNTVLDKLTIEDPLQQGYRSAPASNSDTSKWVQVDLGDAREIAGILLFPCHHTNAGFGFPVRYRVEVCDDASFGSGVTVLASHTAHDVPNPGGTPVLATPEGQVRGRYVRIWADRLAQEGKTYTFALAELAVVDGTGENLTMGAPVTCLDTVDDGGEDWRPENLVDGKAYRLALTTEGLRELWQLSRLRLELEEEFPSTELARQTDRYQEELTRVGAEIAALPPISLAYVAMVHHGSGNFAGTGAQGGQPRPIQILVRGEITRPGQLVGPGTFPLMPQEDWRFSLPDGHPEGLRRQRLAEWLVRRDNPLTWRSIANRLWQYHFGAAIAGSPNDFGRMGDLPTHPHLLDWLACELRDNGQSWKHLHRLMVTSRTYRQSSEDDPHNQALDASNHYYWRMNRRALDAESIRDAMLTAAGALDPHMYGPSFQDFVIDKPDHSPHYEYDQYDPLDRRTHRRAIYRFLVRSQPQPFMDSLDCADPSLSVPKRQTTITALQALALLNNRFVLTISELFSQRLERLSIHEHVQVTEGFRLAIGRPPTSAETAQLSQFRREHGLVNTCRCLLNLNEFVFVD